jgi:hypothetical protein
VEVVSVLLQLLYPMEKNPSFPLDNGLGEEEGNLLPQPVIEPKFFKLPAD